MCLILQGSGSLIFSLSSLINSVFTDFSSSWCSDARLHLWTDGNIPAFIAELLWEELHWWWSFLGEELHWRWIALQHVRSWSAKIIKIISQLYIYIYKMVRNSLQICNKYPQYWHQISCKLPLKAPFIEDISIINEVKTATIDIK